MSFATLIANAFVKDTEVCPRSRSKWKSILLFSQPLNSTTLQRRIIFCSWIFNAPQHNRIVSFTPLFLEDAVCREEWTLLTPERIMKRSSLLIQFQILESVRIRISFAISIQCDARHRVQSLLRFSKGPFRGADTSGRNLKFHNELSSQSGSSRDDRSMLVANQNLTVAHLSRARQPA